MDKKKVLFHLFSVMIFMGFLGLAGTAGALDCNDISLLRGIIQYALSLSFLIAGAIGVNKFNIDEGRN